MKNQRMDDPETLNRRARLRELIRDNFSDKDVELLNYIENKGFKRPNQGELATIKKDNSGKSFGDKKAKNLCEMIGLHRRWFDLPVGTHVDRAQWSAQVPSALEAPSARVSASLPSSLSVADPQDVGAQIQQLVSGFVALSTKGRITVLHDIEKRVRDEAARALGERSVVIDQAKE